MSSAKEYYERGLFFLEKDPPNLIKALSLIRKAKDLFQQKGDVQEFNAAVDKIRFIYTLLSENHYEIARDALKKLQYKESIAKSVKAYHHMVAAEPKRLDKASKKIKSLLRDAIIDFLSDIENRVSKDGFSEEYLSELFFVERQIMDVYYPEISDSTSGIPNNLIAKIGDTRKIQRALVNTHELLAHAARDKSVALINAGNIKNGHEMLNKSRDLYKRADFKVEIEDLVPIYQRVYESRGDAQFKKGEQVAGEGRLDKARNHIKRARYYYKKADNDKKVEMSEKKYLDISMNMGNLIAEKAKSAEHYGDLEEALRLYDEAHQFFTKINHRKSMKKLGKKLNDLYSELGEKRYSTAETLTEDSVKGKGFISPETSQLNLPSGLATNADIIFLKLQHYHDALFYFQKADNNRWLRKTEKRIEDYTDNIAEILYNQAKKYIRSRKYEEAWINLKRSKFYYESIHDDRSVKHVEKRMNKIENDVDRQRLNKLQDLLVKKQNLSAEERMREHQGKPPTAQATADQKEQYHCKACGKWVPVYFYDAMQEKCYDCREKIRCEECSAEIHANEIYATCVECKGRFCLDCADKIYDYNQKRCISCRITQKCEICGAESEFRETFHTCPECGHDYCDLHWDKTQNLCVSCRQQIKCNACGKELTKDTAFRCSKCGKLYCTDHFDVNRKVCNQDIEEEICANCGKVIKGEDIAYKCPDCGFMYCENHYSTFHEKCYVCLGKLKCEECGKDLYDEKYYRCKDCHHVFCTDHFNVVQNRCVEDAERSGVCNECGEELGSEDEKYKCSYCYEYFCEDHFNKSTKMCSKCTTEHPENVPQTTPDGEVEESDVEGQIETAASQGNMQEAYNLVKNTLKKIVEKYNQRDILEPEEISFLLKHQINLPEDQSMYVNTGETGDRMIIMQTDDNRPLVALIPEVPLTEVSKYYGDLMQKLNKYLPQVQNTSDGMSTIANLIFYASNDPEWNNIYNLLRQSLLKPAVETLNALMLVFEKASYPQIIEALHNSPFEATFAGYDIEDVLNFVQTNETEEEIGLFSDNDRLDQMLRILYNLHVGNVIRASEILSIFEV